ncbi:MAG: Ig-like domain-containing protein [Anaerolineales bacterium]|nr:Ig-like domain-containing protein [Anaerolineales bacterium]MCB8954241.1 Ig-like domain-containing protein [Ardenticatenales bacterium]
MRKFSRTIIVLLVLMAGFALSPYMELSAQKLDWQLFGSGYECTQNCLRSVGIYGVSVPYGQGYVVGGFVFVRDENNQPVNGAIVAATWTLPNGSTQSRYAQTNASGIARFLTTDGVGVYNLTIQGMQKAGYTFDDVNSVLSKNIVVP